MAKPKTKNWKQKNFSLDVDVIEKIAELAEFEKMTESEFIEFIVLNWDSGINPEDKLNRLLTKRKYMVGEINGLENEIKLVSDQISMFNEWKKEKAKKKVNAIEILERLILKKEFGEAERISKVWQKMTGISSIELIMEARENVQTKGQ